MWKVFYPLLCYDSMTIATRTTSYPLTSHSCYFRTRDSPWTMLMFSCCHCFCWVTIFALNLKWHTVSTCVKVVPEIYQEAPVETEAVCNFLLYMSMSADTIFFTNTQCFYRDFQPTLLCTRNSMNSNFVLKIVLFFCWSPELIGQVSWHGQVSTTVNTFQYVKKKPYHIYRERNR